MNGRGFSTRYTDSETNHVPPHDVDPAAAVDCPVGQTEQVVWPVVDVKVPTAQAVHVCPVPL